MTIARSLIVTLIAFGFIVQPAGAKPLFYKDKIVRIIASGSAGSLDDRYSRIVARHISKHIPGKPKTVVLNMPGGAGILAANWVYNIPKRNGLTLGALDRSLALKSVLGVPRTRFDPVKFNWIGTPVQETESCFVRSGTAYTSANDLVTAGPPVKMEATHRSSYIVPRILNSVIGTNIKVIFPDQDSKKSDFAARIEQVDGICGWNSSTLKALDKPSLAKIRILLQIGRNANPAFQDVPLASTFADPKKKGVLDVYNQQLSVGRPWAMPPDVPSERVATLRKAFAKLGTDPAFLKAAEDARIDINPLSGKELQALVTKLVDIPAERKPELKKLFDY